MPKPSSFDCPLCGEAMTEAYKRIVIQHSFAKVNKTKTRMSRVFHCESCGKTFALLLSLREVQVVDKDFRHKR